MSTVTISDALMARIQQQAVRLNVSVDEFAEAALESRVGQLADKQAIENFHNSLAPEGITIRSVAEVAAALDPSERTEFQRLAMLAKAARPVIALLETLDADGRQFVLECLQDWGREERAG